jgi:type IV secretory pathway TrbF-like protein
MTSYKASGATHILTSQQLSGSKTHKWLSSKSKVKPYVVRPEWVLDSVEAGKRLAEKNYNVVEDMSTTTLQAMFNNLRSSKSK